MKAARFLRSHTVLLVSIVATSMLANPAPADACTIDMSKAPTPEQLVERAAIIVHVRARGYCEGSTKECAQLPNAIAKAGPVGAGGPGRCPRWDWPLRASSTSRLCAC